MNEDQLRVIMNSVAEGGVSSPAMDSTIDPGMAAALLSEKQQARWASEASAEL